MTNCDDPHAQDCIGEIRGERRAVPPIDEYEASGRFNADPYGPLSAASEERVARMAATIRANRESRAPSSVSDQLEAAYRLAESCSPGHERLRNPENPSDTKTAGWTLPSIFTGYRRPKIDGRDDVAQQIDDVTQKVYSPLQTAATVVGLDADGFRHIRVFTPSEVIRAAQSFLPPAKAVHAQCRFCYRRNQKAKDCAILLRGRGYWIDARLACERCQRRLNKSAERIDVELTWVRRETDE